MSVKYLILLKLETTCFPNQYELHNGWFPEIIGKLIGVRVLFPPDSIRYALFLDYR